ncbi:hypothetical protein [uncultured Kordia sp.]|uniref:hypothetical protein n=1 Tax=uncultured Kordia sp. TaxID=507699 RepID=UPI002623812C|nr:hypothetical protein [uncultured Kordia sp.]
MKKTAKILTQVQAESDENIVLCLEELINDSKLSSYKLNKTEKNSSYFISGGQNLDVKKGSQFDIIFNIENPSNYISSLTKLSEIKLRKNIDLEILPEGYGGIVLIDFLETKPDIIKVLDRDRGNYKALYLTTQPILNRILELLNK